MQGGSKSPEELTIAELERKLATEATAIRDLLEKSIDAFFGEQAFKDRAGVYASTNLQRALGRSQPMSAFAEESAREELKRNIQPKFKNFQIFCEQFEKDLKEIKNIVNPEIRVTFYRKKVQEMLNNPQVLGRDFSVGPGKLFTFSTITLNTGEKLDIKKAIAERADNMSKLQEQLNTLKDKATPLAKVIPEQENIDSASVARTLNNLISQVTDLQTRMGEVDEKRNSAEKVLRSTYKDVKGGIFTIFTGKEYLTKEKLLKNLEAELKNIKIAGKSPYAVLNAMDMAIAKMELGMKNNRTQIFPSDNNNVLETLASMKKEIHQLTADEPKKLAPPKK